MSESRSSDILQRLAEQAPKDNVKLTNYISALRDSLEDDAKDRQEQEENLKGYQEAYEKLTAPANRIGIFIEWLPDDLALVSLGDSEFVSQVDPTVDRDLLTRGARIRVNDAYAIVGLIDVKGGGSVVRVSDVMEDGRMRVGSDMPGGEGKLVLRAESLKDEIIRSGDEVRVDATGKVAIEHFTKKETRDYFFEEIPELPWESVGGQDEAIRLIRETIELPLLHPEIFKAYDKKPIKGMLLYGPPGCGKTLIGKATAYNLTKDYSQQLGRDVKEYFMHISGPKILNMWLGETERMVREIFATARERAKEGRLVFIFMDEAESVLRTRSSGRWLNISNTVVPQFCAELDGLVSLENVVLMLTSNRPDYIDPAVLRPERIDRKIKIARPNRAAAEQIMGIYLHDRLPLDPDIMKKYGGEVDCARRELAEAAIDDLWQAKKEAEFLKISYKNGSNETLYWKDLVSGALIKSIVDRAKDLAIRRAIAAPTVANGITLEDIQQSIRAEYRENEIFPKSEVQEDWLKLLDVEPDRVASVKPVGSSKGEEFVRRSVI